MKQDYWNIIKIYIIDIYNIIKIDMISLLE